MNKRKRIRGLTCHRGIQENPLNNTSGTPQYYIQDKMRKENYDLCSNEGLHL